MNDIQDTKGARVLVVDDEPTLLRALEALLRKKGHQVTALESPISATQKLAQEDFDVAFWPRSFVCIEGLALLRLAELTGVATPGNFPRCPPIARLPVRANTYEDLLVAVSRL